MPSKVAFSVPFRCEMTPDQAARLRALTGLRTHLSRPGEQRDCGIAVLDRHTSLHLVRGDEDDKWALEARTTRPGRTALLRGYLQSAREAARALDPSVPAPCPALRGRPLPSSGLRSWRKSSGKYGLTPVPTSTPVPVDKDTIVRWDQRLQAGETITRVPAGVDWSGRQVGEWLDLPRPLTSGDLAELKARRRVMIGTLDLTPITITS